MGKPPRKRPTILLPDWYETESGLLLHSSVFAPRAPGQPAPSSPPLPGELRPRLQPIALARNMPSFMDQVAMFADEEAAGLPISSLDEVRAWIRTVPFETGMTMVAAIAAKSFGLLGDQPRQLKFAERVFGDGPVFQRLRAFALREGPKAHLFAEQHALILARIMIEEARDEALGRDLTQLEAATIARALLGCSAIAGAPLKQYAEDGGTLEEVMAILFQNGAYNSKNMLMGEMARVVELYDRVHHHPELLPSADKICPLDEWMIDDYGFSVEEQLRIGFSLGAMTRGLADGDEAGQINFLTPEQLDDLLINWA